MPPWHAPANDRSTSSTMSIDNPYQSPSEEEIPLSAEQRTLRIAPFPVRESEFHCSVVSPQEMSRQLEECTGEYCRELGFIVTDGEANFQIEGEITRVIEGNRFERFWSLGSNGYAKVELEGIIRRSGEEEHPFQFTNRKSSGFLGGDSGSLLRLSPVQLAFSIGDELARFAGQAVRVNDGWAWIYMSFLLSVSVVLSAGVGFVRYVSRTLVTEPLPPPVLVREAELSFVFGCLVLGVLAWWGVALAPRFVLTSSMFHRTRVVRGFLSVRRFRFFLAAIGAVFLIVAIAFYWGL